MQIHHRQLRMWRVVVAVVGAVSCSLERDPPGIGIAILDKDASRSVSVPISMPIDLPEGVLGQASADRVVLALAGENGGPSLIAQFEPESPGSTAGRIWSVLPAHGGREKRFRLSASRAGDAAVVRVHWNRELKYVDVSEGERRILRYNQGRTAVPEGISKERGRGDYISRLYGLSGELLTDDYPEDHPHHNAINWSWATVSWKGRTQDFFAGSEGGVRPVRLRRLMEGPVFALIDAENEWTWDSGEAIVNERAVMRIFRKVDGLRIIDLELFLTAVVDDLEFAGRLPGTFGEDGYSGFNIRMAPAQGEEVEAHIDGPGRSPRRAWADYSALFSSGEKASGLTILQHSDNPMYPSEWLVYPSLNFVQPSYPGNRLIPMRRDETLEIRYRLVIHSARPTEEQLIDLWDAYNLGPQSVIHGRG